MDFFLTAMGWCVLVILIISVYNVLTGKRAKIKEQIRMAERKHLIRSDKAFLNRQKELGLDFVENTKSFARGMAKELEMAFPIPYQANVYNRMVTETNFSEDVIHELMFEQKRFLLMASVLKNVPMFSKDVDEVWHQLLMFTREYKAFTEGFAGQFIHHAPNVDGEDGYDDKFIFDMMYKELFKEMSFSSKCWGSKFYETKPSSHLIREWKNEPINALEGHYFFSSKRVTPISHELTIRIVNAVKESERGGAQQFKSHRDSIRKKARLNSRRNRPSDDNVTALLTLPYIFWVTSYDSGGYSDSLGHTVTTGNGYGNSGSGGSGDSGSNSCGSSGGGSSCGSSCGGGCGSS